jgi:glycosyltransferase involved in cell wall biosynthesis
LTILKMQLPRTTQPIDSMTILQVCTSDRSGGAEKAAYDLYLSSRLKGHQAFLAVGKKTIDDDHIIEIDNNSDRNLWARFWRRHQQRLYRQNRPRSARLCGWPANLSELDRWLDWQRGYEDFDYPGSRRLLSLPTSAPDIVHMHNLHGNYFDLREVATISQHVPVFVTLHDEWLLTGHCSSTFGCERWETGCGECPHLATYPGLKRDGTRRNLAVRSRIYQASRLHICSPSGWLLDRANRSVLKSSIVDSRVISPGVDLSVFQPGDRAKSRLSLGIPPNETVFLYLANNARQNPSKDFSTIEQTLQLIASAAIPEGITFLIIGMEGRSERSGEVTIRYSGYQSDPVKVATFYQSADVFLHAARAENFPYTIIEALCCGVPVVATAVGGIPEQITDGFNGFLVPPRDSAAMAARAIELLYHRDLRRQISAQAAANARKKYDLNRQTAEYLRLYEQALLRPTTPDTGQA